MQVFGATKNPALAIVGCQHGDELLGQQVIDRYRQNLEPYPGLQLVLANEEALALGQRGVDGDLNRSYPGDPNGNHEERLAAKIMKTVADAEFVLDLHTTKSEVDVFPIIVRYDDKVRRLLNATDYTQVAYMDLPHGGRNSGLANFSGAGLALEFYDKYVNKKFDEVYAGIDTIVRRILARETRPPQTREIFHVTELTPWKGTEGFDLHNFKYSEALGGYSVIPDGISYRGKHRGFTARERLVEPV